ncbi:molybdopterin-guanine dinucleotide biosynthesis protein B [Leeia aquatica]|uniref:Molybdopterin-guanine dinucleotide biosynthesis protein B n=1 Tax=Leeia aquatica TaxID=2725557 RepID=A0A847S495_9NEIS|nr:molybdopterin-guanine dinucleotide biosynthesis protein B [Leeia aquatica]NLR74584.1 molybdopterin-guanine dinucleotide biosynthesis protein B [Leeia aquatica]
MAYPAVLGLVGWSGSGKTQLLEQLLPLLQHAGLRVSVIKHSHHDVTLEPPGKDSARARVAGAQQVLLSSPWRWALVNELRGAPEPELPELLTRLDPVDLVLVESFKRGQHARLEVWRPALGKPPLYPEDAGIVAVASDIPAVAGATCAWLDLNNPPQIAAWLLQQYQAGAWTYNL